MQEKVPNGKAGAGGLPLGHNVVSLLGKTPSRVNGGPDGIYDSQHIDS